MITPSRPASHRRTAARTPALWGTLLGIVSALGYTGANIFLRTVVESDPMWVSCIKAVPTVVMLTPWLVYRSRLGESVLPARTVCTTLILAGLFGQLGGNVCFQFSLGLVGISLTVPLCLGAIIGSSALLGRIFLGEPLTGRSLVAMGLLLVAIWTLSLGAEQASQWLQLERASAWSMAVGVTAACFSGIAYAVLGVAIRHSVIGKASVASTTFMTALVGVASLGVGSLTRLGWDEVWRQTDAAWPAMLLGGLCNFVAFISLTKALQLTSLIYVNALNASQVALASLAGILLFNEPPSGALGWGVGLTIVGVILMPSSHQPGPKSRDSVPRRERGVEKPRKRPSSSAKRPSSQRENEQAFKANEGSHDGSLDLGSAKGPP